MRELNCQVELENNEEAIVTRIALLKRDLFKGEFPSELLRRL